MKEMKQYLIDVEAEAIKMFQMGYSADQVYEMDIPTSYQEWWFERFYYYNLKFVYEQKEKEEI